MGVRTMGVRTVGVRTMGVRVGEKLPSFIGDFMQRQFHGIA